MRPPNRSRLPPPKLSRPVHWRRPTNMRSRRIFNGPENMAMRFSTTRKRLNLTPISAAPTPVWRRGTRIWDGDRTPRNITSRRAPSVLEMNPSFVLAYVGTALSELAEGRSGEAAETYRRMEKLGPQGASAASIGLADLALYEGRAADAVGDLEKGIAGDFENKNPDSAANKLTTLAYAQLLSGHRALAGSAADKALATSKEDNVLFWAARVYLVFDDETRALALAQSLAGRLETDPQAYAKLIDGEVELKRGRAADAVKLFREAQKLADTWFGRFDLGLAYLDAEAFTEAYSEFELCLKRRGEATAAFLDEVPTYRLVPPVYYYLGRAQEGLKSPAAADSYKTFLAIKEKSGEDPLVVDARRRIGLR